MRLASILLLGSSLLPAPIDASIMFEGVAPLYATLVVRELPIVGREGAIQVICGGRYSGEQTGQLRIDVPDGLTVVQGATQRTIHVSDAWTGTPDSEWYLRIRAERLGRFSIIASLNVDVGGEYGRDELDFELTLDARADTTLIESSRPVRLELVRKGQRYRYGDLYLIPLTRSERVLNGDIIEPARVTRKVRAECRKCSKDVVKVGFVVFLDENGKLVSSRPLPSETPDGQVEVISAARTALSQWGFSPARTRHHSTASYQFVEIEVHP